MSFLVQLILVLFLGDINLTLQLCSHDLYMCIMLFLLLLQFLLVSLMLRIQIQICSSFLQRKFLLLQVLYLIVQCTIRSSCNLWWLFLTHSTSTSLQEPLRSSSTRAYVSWDRTIRKQWPAGVAGQGSQKLTHWGGTPICSDLSRCWGEVAEGVPRDHGATGYGGCTSLGPWWHKVLTLHCVAESFSLGLL